MTRVLCSILLLLAAGPAAARELLKPTKTIPVGTRPESVTLAASRAAGSSP
jgi:hypothetical protein